MGNTISDDLKLTEILDFALEEFERTIMPLSAFSTVFSDVSLKGDDTVTVPYYPIEDSESETRTAGQSYRDKVSATTVDSKQITLNKNKIQGLSYTNEEVSRQPFLNVELHGRNKGRKLAYDILKDIFSVVKRQNFTSSTLAPVVSADFDVDDIKSLAQKCVEDEWPGRRHLFLNPTLHYEVVGQPAIMDFSQSGTTAALYLGQLPSIMGFMTHPPQNALHLNNGTATSCVADAGTDALTATAHGLANGDIVRFGGTGGDVPAGLAINTDYYVRDSTANTFKVAATASGAAIDLTDAGTGVTFTSLERLGGFAVYESAILTAFAPIEPTAGIRSKLIDYRQVTSSSGLVLEYKHLADEFIGTEYQIIECHYGYALGETAALKRIETTD